MAAEITAISIPQTIKGAALITGGGQRIGRAISLALAGKGYDIALHYHSSRQDAEMSKKKIESLGRRCQIFPYDLNHDNDLDTLSTAVFEVFPECNILINNASVFEPGRLMEINNSIFDRHFSINFKSPVFLSQNFARRCQKGNIINVLDSRVAGNDTEHFAYTLSKKSLLEFTKMAAKDLAPHIRVNAICPGFILPPVGKEESYARHKSSALSLEQTGRLDTLVSSILFLIDNCFITGESLYVDGGEHIR